MDTSGLPSAADALRQLNGFQTVDSASALNTAQQKYGVNELSGKVNTLNTLTGNLTNAIAAVDPSVTGRTAGSLVTEGQRSALVARERAPVVGQLGTANQSLGLAKDEYNTADTKARGEADATYRDNQDKYNKLKTTYELANAREEAARQAAAQAEARRQEQANADRQFAESQRQFNEGQATTRGSSKYGGGSGSADAPAPGSTQRADKGFNFQSADGKAISARLYAQLTGTSFNTLLKTMAAKGDKGAADVLKNGGSSKYYKSLTWN